MDCCHGPRAGKLPKKGPKKGFPTSPCSRWRALLVALLRWAAGAARSRLMKAAPGSSSVPAQLGGWAGEGVGNRLLRPPALPAAAPAGG